MIRRSTVDYSYIWYKVQLTHGKRKRKIIYAQCCRVGEASLADQLSVELQTKVVEEPNNTEHWNIINNTVITNIKRNVCRLFPSCISISKTEWRHKLFLFNLVIPVGIKNLKQEKRLLKSNENNYTLKKNVIEKDKENL